MSRHNRIVITVFLSLSTLCIAFAGCNYAPNLVWLLLGNPDSSGNMEWRQLPPPPVEVKEIIAADYFTVYVKTADNRIWGCYRESKLDIQCWFEVSQLPEMEEDWDNERGLFAEPPNGIVVVQEYQIDYPEGRDTRSAFSYILDGDGHVWQWGFERFLYFGPPTVMRISFWSSLGGCTSGLLIPIIFIGILWRIELGSMFRR